MNNEVTRLNGIDNEKYWTRVDRSLCWLGETDSEQKARQEILASKTVGVAGCGRIGGALALRLARLGIKHIKVADPDQFDWTNINRQLGASKDTVGQNKAEVVGHMVHELSGDVTVDIFPQGITNETAEPFATDCDFILDQMDFYLLDERYALHQAFRIHSKASYILSAWCIGWGTSIFKWAKEGMTIEEYFNIPAGTPITPEVIRHLMTRFIPKQPPFPSKKTIDHWFIDKLTVPLFAGSPPIAEGFAINRAALLILDMEHLPYVQPLPIAPDAYVYDTSSLQGEVVSYNLDTGNFVS